MAFTGFKAIGQVAEILGRPEIDDKGRHFIMDLLTKTLGENIQLRSSLDEKNQDLCELHIDNRGYKDQVEMMEKAIESLKDTVRTKDEEILKFMKNERCYKAKIQEQDDNAERALGETAEVIEQLEEEIKMINESRQKVAKQLKEKDDEIEHHKHAFETLFQDNESLENKLREKNEDVQQMAKQLKEKDDEIDKHKHAFETLFQDNEYLENKLREKGKEKYIRSGEYKLPESRCGWENFNLA